METTKGKYYLDDMYTPERKKLHEEIIAHFLSVCVEDAQTPDSLLLGGGSAVGKSTISTLFLDSYKENGEPITHIDADKIKEHLPEYKEMIESESEDIKAKAAFYVHDESSDIAEELLQICIQKRHNFMYDGTMKNAEKYERIIERLRRANFKITAIIVDIPLQLALERAQKRYEIEGRMVPGHVIEESHMKVADTFSRIKNEVDSYIMYDNTKKPPVMFTYKPSKDQPEMVMDQERLDEFYSKSSLT